MNGTQQYFHTVAYRGSVVNATTNTAIAGVQDDVLTRAASNAFLAPPGCRIRAGIAGGVNASRARIDTAEARKVGLPYIAPLNTGITAPSPPNVADYGPSGIRPQQNDEVAVQSTHTDAAPQIQFAGLWFYFNRVEPQGGNEYRLRFTSAITGVVGSWASGALTFDQVLAVGKYQITGLDVFGTNLLLARLLFTGGGWRPGCLARNAVGSVPHPLFTAGALGVWGEFDSTTPPQLQTYVEAANTAQEGYVDVIKIA